MASLTDRNSSTRDSAAIKAMQPCIIKYASMVHPFSFVLGQSATAAIRR